MNQWKGNPEAFRTYFHGRIGEKNKSIPNEKVKDQPGHPWEKVCHDENFGTVLNDGYIDISFDSKELSDAFLKMAKENNWESLILNNPQNNHIHSIWKKPLNWREGDGRDKILAVGLIADLHSGSTYIRLRDNGIDRFPPVYEPEHIQEIPEELYPVKTTYKPFGMSAGKGRNITLSGMAKNMVYNTRFTREQIERIITNTNRFIFSQPVSDSELATILRDETFAGISERGLHTLNAIELFQMDIEPVEFIIEGLVPVGLVLLASPPKYGKSWFCMNMGLAVSTGKDFLGFKTNKSEVLYLALEDRFDRLKERITKNLAGEPFPAWLNFGIDSTTLDNGFLESVEDYLKDHSKTKLIIIDTFIKIRGEAKRNESAYAVDSREAGIIKKFADQHKIAVVLVTHTRKGIDPDDSFVNISGTYGVAGAADDMIVLTKQKRSDDVTKMSITGRDISYEDFAIILDKGHGIWKRLADSFDDFMARTQMEIKRAEYLTGNTRKTIMKLLEENGGTWTGFCKAIIDKSKEYGTPISLTSQKLGKELAEINGFLFEDSILHTEISKGTAASKHKFEKV